MAPLKETLAKARNMLDGKHSPINGLHGRCWELSFKNESRFGGMYLAKKHRKGYRNVKGSMKCTCHAQKLEGTCRCEDSNTHRSISGRGLRSADLCWGRCLQKP